MEVYRQKHFELTFISMSFFQCVYWLTERNKIILECHIEKINIKICKKHLCDELVLQFPVFDFSLHIKSTVLADSAQMVHSNS
jgi:hypothetical protein